MNTTVWIIDGNNFLNRDRHLAEVIRDGGGWASAVRLLETELTRFRSQRGRGHSVLLVYDGPEDPTSGRPTRTKGFRVVYSGPDREADQVVLEEARRLEGRTEVHVITSDRHDIGTRLRGLRVTWHSAEEFGPLLRKGRSDAGASAGAADEKPRAPRGREVDEWLERFSDPAADD